MPTWWMPVTTNLIVGLGIPVPTLAGLSAQFPGPHLRLELRGRPVALVAGALEHVLARPVRDVEPAEVAEAERPHRPVEPFLDRGVDVLEAGDAGIEQAVRLLGRGVQDAVDDEPVDLLVDEDRRPADRARHRQRAIDGFVRGL